MKKLFNCSGAVLGNEDGAGIIQLTGDQVISLC